ncbi:guanine-N(7)-methyltransferase domain-containing protein [Zychaea mexicana]|uniref:guanine-N(7)-methyltransferase domain-containing protein n=1 Tax=Zychaea mexicana TaxID=64656 RepID=UPI0022FF279A|nr:guanine-N(7)-methyltransferase domain-containing protein [Zychaea mexicana]KAI9499274.1 guanine-N(7)-methyltransferase domain-containing protein [Zychaea mexicana]
MERKRPYEDDDNSHQVPNNYNNSYNNKKRSFHEDRDSNKVSRTHTRTDAAKSAHLVAKHYNDRPDVGVEKRKESKIIRLRSFNNWIKSVLIQRHVRQRDTVFDMGCGKGGDLNKFAKARIHHLVAADVAHVSLEQMQKRYRTLRTKSFTAEFYAMDCYKELIAPKLHRSIGFDAVSMQFCLHYAFETEEKARTMLENVSTRLRSGGRFIGTMPDANWIVKRVREQPKGVNKFGNSIYHIDFEDTIQDENKETGFSKFGCKYMFHLEDAVDCPEYLVHWPTFERLAKSYGLKLTFKQNFHELYRDAARDKEFGWLLQKIGVVGGSQSEMSEEEWEAARVYLAFAFEKM